MNASPWHRTLLRQMERTGLHSDDVTDERFAALLQRVHCSTTTLINSAICTIRLSAWRPRRCRTLRQVAGGLAPEARLSSVTV